MRVHLLSQPNVQTTAAYSLDGFCQMTIKFARLLTTLGAEVILYASEENEAPCHELVTVISKDEQRLLLNAMEPTPYQYARMEPDSPLWRLANARMIAAIADRKRPKDLICFIGGWSQHPVIEAHPDLMAVEYSIGYSASVAPYRVFESRAWQHLTYGAQHVEDGRFFDAVIPCFYDPEDFPLVEEKEPFALYVGRLVPRKGISAACQIATAAGLPLKVIGHGDPRLVSGAEYLGAVEGLERNKWMSRAQVVLCPTLFIEPFNQVAVEAQLCGTPVISTDFGGFTETIEEGKTGFRCTYLGEFVRAIKAVPSLDPLYIRHRAVSLYSTETAQASYQRYFDRLSLLWDQGWDTI